MVIMLIAAAAAVPPIQLEAESRPVRPYAEDTGFGIDVDGDILVRNRSDVPLHLTEIEVSTRDSEGHLLHRKTLNENGTSPSIGIVTDRQLPAKRALLIFSPFSKFPEHAAPTRMDFRLTFENEDGSRTAVASTVITPREEGRQTFHFPLNGRVLVWDGHDFASHHRRWNYLHPVLQAAGYNSNAARYSFDLVPVGEQGDRAKGDESVNENWIGFGQPVFAVGPGTVAAVRSDQPDDRNFDPATASIPNALYGNYVVVKHGDGSYSIYGHLMHESAAVKVGDKVEAGQQLARIGASGSALFPHLHFQRMDGPTDRGEGIPTRFGDLVRPNGKAPENGFVDSGDIIIAR